MACPACEGIGDTCELCAAPGAATIPCAPPTIPAPSMGVATGEFQVAIIRLDSPPSPYVIELPDRDA